MNNHDHKWRLTSTWHEEQLRFESLVKAFHSNSKLASESSKRKKISGGRAENKYIMEAREGRSVMPCDVCLGLDRFADDRWKIEIKADLTPEYSLAFLSSQLMESVESGCTACSMVLRGLDLISRNLSLFDASRPFRGRFILQPDNPLEVEIFHTAAEEPSIDTFARVQFYAHSGAHAVFRY
jgi:hypothetical protein